MRSLQRKIKIKQNDKTKNLEQEEKQHKKRFIEFGGVQRNKIHCGVKGYLMYRSKKSPAANINKEHNTHSSYFRRVKAAMRSANNNTPSILQKRKYT